MSVPVGGVGGIAAIDSTWGVAGAAGATGGASGAVTMSLRRRLADEGARKAATQSALQRSQRAAEHQCRQLEVLLGRCPLPPDGGEAFVNGVEECVRALDGELQGALAMAERVGASSGATASRSSEESNARTTGGYDVLRHSLELSQRRCDDLNADMARQAEANEELVATLGTVKDTNKRLLEQIRVQTEEITRLTQQRVDDEERIEGLLRRHSTAEHLHEQEARQRLAEIRETANERLASLEQKLTERLRCIGAKLRPLSEAVTAIKRSHRDVLDNKVLVQDFAALMAVAEAQTSAKVCEHLRAQEQKKESILEESANLASLLESEADQRADEAAQRTQRQALLAIERQSLEAKTAREVQLHASQLQALKRTIQAEFDADSEDRDRYGRIVEKLAGERDERSGALEETNREILRLESMAMTTSSEAKLREQSLRELKRQARQSDDALVAAVNSNEHLRQQIDEHRQRAQEVGQAELQVVTSNGELRIAKASDSRALSVQAANEEIQCLEKKLEDLSAGAARHRAQGEALASENEALITDLAAIRLQYSSASSARQALEQELANARKEFVQERLRMQAAIEAIGPQKSAAEAELNGMAERFHAFKRDVLSQETELTSRVAALEDLVRDAQRQLSDAKTRLAETQDTLAKTLADAAHTEKRERELQFEGEEKLEQRRRELDEERRRLEAHLVSERQSATTSCEQAEQQCEAHAASLRQVREDSTAKVAALEREKTATGEAHQEELALARREAQERRARIDALERDLGRVRLLLAESHGNLTWVRQERERETRESGSLRDRLEDERRYATGDLSIAIEEEASAEAQLRAAQAEQADQARNFAREMQAMKSKIAAQEVQATEQAELVQREREAQTRVAEARLWDTVDANRLKLEAILRENDQLRSQLGAGRDEGSVRRSLELGL